MSLILIYLKSNNNNTITNFLNNCLDKDKIIKTISINLKDEMYFNEYFNELKNYQYTIYLNDNYEFTEKFYIEDYIKILNVNNIHQIYFCENNSKYKKNDNNLIFTEYKKYN